MLETFTLKQHLDVTRQELSQALYQHDAACRVIARLMRERDEARSALMALQQSGINTSISSTKLNGNESMDLDRAEIDVVENNNGGLGADVVGQINDMHKALSSTRKGRKTSETLLPRETIATFSVYNSSTLHKSDKPGVSCIASKTTSSGQNLIASGGVDKMVILSQITVGKALKVLAKLSGHQKKISSVGFHPDPTVGVIVSGSADQLVKVNFKCEIYLKPSYNYSLKSLDRSGRRMVGKTRRPIRKQ